MWNYILRKSRDFLNFFRLIIDVARFLHITVRIWLVLECIIMFSYLIPLIFKAIFALQTNGLPATAYNFTSSAIFRPLESISNTKFQVISICRRCSNCLSDDFHLVACNLLGPVVVALLTARVPGMEPPPPSAFDSRYLTSHSTKCQREIPKLA
ncbi:hypothetical protein L2E82_13527 [Cichorium intybus]|uniref:Uncharacterized protein n=1 Tax=Cichorium intybus TaxID=13427 RepID=A0ACB9EX01_CICIN|nr:hypothetical protein L2E82_13527 [Cichorium intybus]